jgi:hypothetical protein
MPIACLPEDKRLFMDGAGGACGIRGPLRIAMGLPGLDLTTVVAGGLNSFRRGSSAHVLNELKRLST